MQSIILASASGVRAQLLTQARVPFEVIPARVDEQGLKASLISESAPPRDIADALAETKARKIAVKHPGTLVLGCDQICSCEGRVLSKPESRPDAESRLNELRARQHELFSAAVIYEDAKPVWRHVGRVRIHMHDFSGAWIKDYIDRNWDSIRYSVGCYKLEEEGARLISRVEGDYFNVLGLPLIELLSYLTLRGVLAR